MADFTIILMGFDPHTICVVVEPVYVVQALTAWEAGQLAADAYTAQTGIPVRPLYAAPGPNTLEKLTFPVEGFVTLPTPDPEPGSSISRRDH